MTSKTQQQAQRWVLEMLEQAEPGAAFDGASHEEALEIGAEVKRLAGVLRSALAQPAAGEPVAWECYEPASEWNGYKGREYLSREKPKGCAVRATPLFRTAPPAAAHGDEAARKAPWAEEHEAFKKWARSRITPLKLDLDEVGLFYDEVAGVAHDAWQARAAMRAQAGERGE